MIFFVMFVRQNRSKIILVLPLSNNQLRVWTKDYKEIIKRQAKCRLHRMFPREQILVRIRPKARDKEMTV